MGPAAALEAVFFDFDGVIIDSDVAMLRAVTEIYKQYGLGIDGLFELFRADVGRSSRRDYDSPVQRIAENYSKADRYALRDEFLRQWGPRPCIRFMLGSFRSRGLHLAIVSNSPREWVTGNLVRLGLDSDFDVIHCADGEGIPWKPSPAVYRLACREAGVSPNQALALEDSLPGTGAAAAAGVHVVAYPTHLTQSDFSQLPAISARKLASILGAPKETLQLRVGDSDTLTA